MGLFADGHVAEATEVTFVATASAVALMLAGGVFGLLWFNRLP